MKATANTVSRALTLGGMRAVPRNRQGIHLIGGDRGRVCVTADCDLPSQEHRLSADAETVLAAKGFEIDRRDATTFYACEPTADVMPAGIARNLAFLTGGK